MSTLANGLAKVAAEVAPAVNASDLTTPVLFGPAPIVKDSGPKLADGPFTITPLIGGSWLLQHGAPDSWSKKGDNDQTKSQRAFTSNADLVRFIAGQLGVSIRADVKKPDHPAPTDQRTLMERLRNRKPHVAPRIPGPAPGQPNGRRHWLW